MQNDNAERGGLSSRAAARRRWAREYRAKYPTTTTSTGRTYICRIDGRAGHGYSVRVLQTPGSVVARFFSDSRHGGRLGAFYAALAWRNETAATLGRPVRDRVAIRDDNAETTIRELRARIPSHLPAELRAEVEQELSVTLLERNAPPASLSGVDVRDALRRVRRLSDHPAKFRSLSTPNAFGLTLADLLAA